MMVVATHYVGKQQTEEALRGHYLRVADEYVARILKTSRVMSFRLSKALVGERPGRELIGIRDSSGDKIAVRLSRRAGR